VLLAIRRWATRWAGYTVHAYIDNQGVIGALEKGLTKNCTANDILKLILWLTAMHDITLKPIYIPSEENYIADPYLGGMSIPAL